MAVAVHGCVYFALTYSCVEGTGRHRERAQRFEAQGQDTCEQAPP